MNADEELALSRAIEDILVARNPRGMKTVQPHLEAGYCLRAARKLQPCRGNILIGTGFPVVRTFETDGPVGAIAMYEAFEKLGATPTIVCGRPLSQALAARYRVHEISVGDHDRREQEALEALQKFQPRGNHLNRAPRTGRRWRLLQHARRKYQRAHRLLRQLHEFE